MAKSPQRKKPADGGRQLAPRFQTAPSNLDLAVLQALILLSTADCLEFADHQWPPAEICRWLEKADLRQLRGLLLATLDRWHSVHRRTVGGP